MPQGVCLWFGDPSLQFSTNKPAFLLLLLRLRLFYGQSDPEAYKHKQANPSFSTVVFTVHLVWPRWGTSRGAGLCGTSAAWLFT